MVAACLVSPEAGTHVERRWQRHYRLDLLFLHRLEVVLVPNELKRQHRGEADELGHGHRVLLLAALLAVVLDRQTDGQHTSGVEQTKEIESKTKPHNAEENAKQGRHGRERERSGSYCVSTIGGGFKR